MGSWENNSITSRSRQKGATRLHIDKGTADKETTHKQHLPSTGINLKTSSLLAANLFEDNSNISLLYIIVIASFNKISLYIIVIASFNKISNHCKDIYYPCPNLQLLRKRKFYLEKKVVQNDLVQRN